MAVAAEPDAIWKKASRYQYVLRWTLGVGSYTVLSRFRGQPILKAMVVNGGDSLGANSLRTRGLQTCTTSLLAQFMDVSRGLDGIS